MAGAGSFFEMKIVPMDEDFTRTKTIHRDDYFASETISSEQSIENEAFKLDIKASQSSGIFFQIQTFNDEILMREKMMTKF